MQMIGAALLGWTGACAGVAAYLYLSRGLWQVTSLRYSSLNCAAGILGGCGSALYGAWPSVFANLLWSGIALTAIFSTMRARRWRPRLRTNQ
jgi:hypothetical protein